MNPVESAVQFHRVPLRPKSHSTRISRTPTFMKTLGFSWSRPPTNLALFEDEVHLWYSTLDLPASNLQMLEATLGLDERERAKGFCLQLERTRFVVGRGLLREILGHYSGIESNELCFKYSPRGKPSLAERFGGDRIQFSLARSNGYVIYAFTLSRRIGVDLERVVPIESEQIANRFFSDREKAALHALNGNEQLEEFFRIWTAKEAYLKACGEGLARPLNEVDFSLNPGESSCLVRIRGVREDCSLWSLWQLRPASGFTAALVLEVS